MSIRSRSANALVASIVSDAASMGSHWIYDSSKLKEVLQDHLNKPEFHEPPACPFYNDKDFPGHYSAGDPSPYGEECLALVEYMETSGGEFKSGEDFAESLLSWSKSYKGRKNHCTKLFEENAQKLKDEGKSNIFPDCGADDAQANAFWKVLPIAARYVTHDSYFDKVEAAIRAHQNNDKAAEYGLGFAKILKDVIEGKPIEEAIKETGASGSELVKEGIQTALENAITSEEDASEEKISAFLEDLGNAIFKEGMDEKYKSIMPKSCAFPQSFIVGLKIVLDAKKMESLQGEDFSTLEFAIRRNIMIGGDTCGRTAVVAGLIGASGAPIPQDWIEKTNNSSSIRAIANKWASTN